MIVDLIAAEQAEIGTSSDCVMCEAKSSDPRTNLTDAKPVNVFQTQVQMGLVREMTEFKPTHSILSYTDASFWSDVKEFVIEFNPAIYEVAKERATLVMTATSGTELKPVRAGLPGLRNAITARSPRPAASSGAICRFKTRPSMSSLRRKLPTWH